MAKSDFVAGGKVLIKILLSSIKTTPSVCCWNFMVRNESLGTWIVLDYKD